ncbi:MAG: hypothetical protein HY903_15945 [Deltaproteobacteria bacterium]|nr:hypothetical protein [Deltaproteobacteria bacterium]
MSKVRVDEISQKTLTPTTTPAEQVRRRKDVHGRSSFERNPATFAGIGKADLSALKAGATTPAASPTAAPITYQLQDGTVLEIPQLSADDRAKVEAILAKLTPDKRARLQASSDELGDAVWDEVEESAGVPGVTGASAGLKNAADKNYETYVVTTGGKINDGANEDLLVLGLSGVENTLFGFFGQIQAKANQSNEMRADIAELEGMLADWPAGKDKQVFSWREVVINPDGTTKVIEHKNEELTKDQAAALLSKLKGQQDALQTISTQDGFKLQMMTEKYQQAMNVLSNILKAQDDTRKGIIGNVKA